LLSKAFDIPEFSVLELDSPDISEEMIVGKMEKASMVYVDGGNTFYLQRYIIESSFWKVIDPYLERGCLYVGASAGAIVACNSIKTALWKGWDDPLVAGKDFEWNEKTLSGRKLQDYSIFMHYNDAEHSELVNMKSKDVNHVVNILRNTEALMHFNGDKKGILISSD
jgi:dipeptidase E